MMALVFDFGGVLFRWQPYELLQQVLPESVPDEASARRLAAIIFESFTPGSDWAQFDLGRIDEATLADRIAARAGIAAARARALIDAIPAHLTAMPETVALLEALAASGQRLFYLSNMPRPYAAHLERVNPFFAHFSDGIFSAHVGLMKPDEAIFRLAAERFGIDPAQTVFIDDHAGNVETARALGWQALQFTDAAQCRGQLAVLGWPVAGG